MKIIMHIGTHKTGTTSIQYFCENNQKILRKNGYYWASTKNNTHKAQHSNLADYIKTDDLAAFQTYLDNQTTKAQKAGCHTLILSGENFCQLREPFLKKLHALLKGHDVEVVVYFRNIYDYVISSLSQRLKNVDQFTNNKTAFSAYSNTLAYDTIIKRWENAFGEDRIFVYSYDQNKRNILKHFLSHLDQSETGFYTKTIKRTKSLNIGTDFASLSFWVMLDLHRKPDEFRKLYKIYQTIFAGSPKIITPFTLDLAHFIVNNIGHDYTHPKLMPFKDILLKRPEPQFSEKDKALYLENMEKFIRRVRGGKMSFLDRVKFLFNL